jgi:hypothetical protein
MATISFGFGGVCADAGDANADAANRVVTNDAVFTNIFLSCCKPYSYSLMA